MDNRYVSPILPPSVWLQEPKGLCQFSKERSSGASQQFLWELWVLWPVKIRILQVRCLHAFSESSLFHLPTTWIRVQEGSKAIIRQKKAWQSQEAIPQKVWREHNWVECKFLFWTIQYHTENTSVFKNYFIEDTQWISDGKSVCNLLIWLWVPSVWISRCCCTCMWHLEKNCNLQAFVLSQKSSSIFSFIVVTVKREPLELSGNADIKVHLRLAKHMLAIQL